MRQWNSSLIVLVLLAGAVCAPADLLWDNYLPNPDGWYDGELYFTSEFSAAVAHPTDPGSWTADDMVLSGDLPAQIERLEWLAIRSPGYDYTAEILILDENFNELYKLTEADGELTFSDEIINDGDPLFGKQAYQGFVDIGQAYQPVLQPGHYYVAARLVSGTVENPGGGRNFILTTSTGDPNDPTNPNGLTEGAAWCPAFGIPNWTLASDYGVPRTDYSYRVRGEIIPEPAAALLLLAGLLLRRR